MAATMMAALRAITVEPVMLVDGACKEAMLLFIENVQMNKICSVNLGFPSDVCANLSAHPEESVRVQREFSVFTFYNSIILSVLPLIFVLFMGAWSDKYGRKIPILVTLVGHVFYAAGYLLANWQTSWPVEVIYFVTLLEALGGTNAGLLSSTISYISDISKEAQRTSRISTANSVWFLGGPIGTLIGALIIKYTGYDLALGLVLLAYFLTAVYVVIFIKESHGPFAKKELKAKGSIKDESSLPIKKVSISTMIADFFNWRRVVESFKTAFKKREGNARAVLMAVMAGNMIRRMARGFFMYLFVRRTLHWDATEYGYWITYRNLMAALGSLFLVPFLTRLLSFTDASLVVVGAVSMIGEYLCYGLVNGPSQEFLIWLGPAAGLISNVIVIAFKSMSTKLVNTKEKGRINAVMAALNGLMPMMGYAAYSPLYYNTVDTFPAAQFFFGAGLNVIIMVTFIVIKVVRHSSSQDVKDLEAGSKTHGVWITALFKTPPTAIVSSSLSSVRKRRTSQMCEESSTSNPQETPITNPQSTRNPQETSITNPQSTRNPQETSITNPQSTRNPQETAITNPQSTRNPEETPITNPQSTGNPQETPITNPQSTGNPQETPITNPQSTRNPQETSTTNPQSTRNPQDTPTGLYVPTTENCGSAVGSDDRQSTVGSKSEQSEVTETRDATKDREQAPCYESHLSDSEITASERSPGETTFVNETVRHADSLSHNKHKFQQKYDNIRDNV